MRKQNRWLHGPRNFAFPELPQDQKGRTGCRFHRITFDQEIGEEVCVVFMEEPKYVGAYNSIHPFNLFSHKGLVRTPHGIIAYVVWRIAAGSSNEVLMEQYLNPYCIETIQLVASAANQTHLKLVVINNQTAEVGAFVDFENVFGLDELVQQMSLAIGHEPEGEFDLAMQYVMANMTIPELLGNA